MCWALYFRYRSFVARRCFLQRSFFDTPFAHERLSSCFLPFPRNSHSIFKRCLRSNKCYKCGGTGHKERDCAGAKSSSSSSSSSGGKKHSRSRSRSRSPARSRSRSRSRCACVDVDILENSTKHPFRVCPTQDFLYPVFILWLKPSLLYSPHESGRVCPVSFLA